MAAIMTPDQDSDPPEDDPEEPTPHRVVDCKEAQTSLFPTEAPKFYLGERL
jgi:hypothetical protein